MPMPDRNIEGYYRYGFQGQENDVEIKGDKVLIPDQDKLGHDYIRT